MPQQNLILDGLEVVVAIPIGLCIVAIGVSLMPLYIVSYSLRTIGGEFVSMNLPEKERKENRNNRKFM